MITAAKVSNQPLKLFWNAVHLTKDGWEKFWFRSPGPAQMRVFRAAAGSVMFFSVFARTFDLELFYGEKGLVRQAALPLIADMSFRHSVFELFPGMTAVWIFHFAFLLGLALMIYGVYPRAMALLALVLHVSFLHRNFAVAYGVDTISTYYLFYLCFADYRPLKGKIDSRRIFGSVSYRLCQIQICLIYAFAGLDKVKGPSWWRGDALWMVFANTQRATLDLSWTAHFPALIAAMTYLTLFWEVYFPVLVWFKPAGRWISLGLGIFLHIGIALTMGLVSFSSLMVSTYSLFLDTAVAEKIAQCVKKIAIPRKVFLQQSDQSLV